MAEVTLVVHPRDEGFVHGGVNHDGEVHGVVSPAADEEEALTKRDAGPSRAAHLVDVGVEEPVGVEFSYEPLFLREKGREGKGVGRARGGEAGGGAGGTGEG